MTKKWISLFATWFNLGRLQPAPGTWGTLGAIPIILVLNLLNPYAYLVMTFGFVVFAIWVCNLYEQNQQQHDRSEIVIDEVAGFLITMTWLPITWQSLVLGFLLFRTLDILKPPPIRWMDQKIGGGVGVMADDVMAGIVANIILQILFVQTSWLGYQLPS